MNEVEAVLAMAAGQREAHRDLESQLGAAKRVATEAIRLLDELGKLPELRHRMDALESGEE
jgi:hypothetical protein